MFADVVNGSFESLFSSWTNVGPNSAVSSLDGVTPTDGNFMAYLNNGSGSLSVGLQETILSNVLGLPASSITASYPNATEARAVVPDIYLGPNETGLQFDWRFLTNEATPSPSRNDFGFVAVWSAANTLTMTGSLDTFSTISSNGSQYAAHTNWITKNIPLTPGNTYHLVFGVFDVGDKSIDSALMIDNIHAIPEPSSLWLGVLGGLCLASAIRRQRSKRSA